MAICKVSIVIPVYNASRYLRRCLESCVNQTLHEIEVIVVNDCSPDPLDSGIMREYEEKFPEKVRCIWHLENKRQGGARNTGVRAARGEYLNFVDADDYIDARMCEKMYDAAKGNDADYIYCDHYVVGDRFRYVDRYNELDAPCAKIKNGHGVLWGGLIRRELFVKYKLNIPEGSLYAEDEPTMLLVLILSKRTCKLPGALYYHCTHPESAMQSSTIFDRYPCLFPVFSHMRRLGEIILTESDLFLFDVKSLIRFFLVLFEFYRQGDFARANDSHEGRMEMLKEYVQDNGLDMFRLIAAIHNDCRRERMAFLWGLRNQSLKDEQVVSQLYSFDVAYIKRLLREFNCVVVWGMGRRGREICRYLHTAGIPFETTDSNVELCSAREFDVQPWDALKERADVVIITPKFGVNEIRKQIGNVTMPIIDMGAILC